MFKFKIALISVLGCIAIGQTAMAESVTQQLKPYPAAEQGYTRQVIFLPTLENEDNAKVELLVGKTMQVDCNRHFFGGELEEKVINGWGYNYFKLEELKGPFATLMACPASSTHEEFIGVNGIELQRYNSKLPIVVYVPNGVEVKYRVWNAGEEIKVAKEQ